MVVRLRVPGFILDELREQIGSKYRMKRKTKRSIKITLRRRLRRLLGRDTRRSSIEA